MLRFVELTRRRYVTHGPLVRVRVSTDAKRVKWRLAGRSGNARPPKLVLPAPSSKGHYTLTVSANGHRARATVIKRK